MLNPKVFKAYDVRGVYGQDWDAAGAALVARGFIEEFGLKTLTLGWDMRLSSPEMVEAIEAACIAAGVRLIKVGMVTTPMLYFATASDRDSDGGIMVTASHNTGEWNGMKLLRGDGMAVGEISGLPAIKERALAGSFNDAAQPGVVEERNVSDDYLDYLFSIVQIDHAHHVSVVVDCGNGMEGVIIKKFFERLPGVTAHILYDEPDGSFPNHEANPLKEDTLTDLKREVIQRGAQLGIAFDGDADRVGFVDGSGRLILGDILLGLVALKLLKKNPGATILYDLRSRRSVARAIEQAGGIALMSRVGHAFIKKQMRETGALFAGELSCHFFFRDFFGVECSDLMVLYVFRLLQMTGKPIAMLASELVTEAHSGEINFHVADPQAAIEKIEAHYAPRAKEISKLDGLLVYMDNWWFNVRPSNTEPVLRLNAEAPTEAILRDKLVEIQNMIHS